MANPTVTIEIRAIDKGAMTKLKAVRAEAEKLVATKKKVASQTKKEETSFKELGRAMSRVISSNKLAKSSLSQVGERMQAVTGNTKLAEAGMRQLGTQMQRVIFSNKLAGQSFNVVGQQMKRVAASNKLAEKSYSDLGRRMEIMMRSRRMEVIASKKQALVARKLSAQQKKTAISSNKLGIGIRNLGSAAIFAVGPLSGFGARLVAFGAIAERTSVMFAVFAATLAAIVVAAVKLTSAMIRTATEVNRIMNALKVATGSAEGARREFEFLIDVSRRLSLDLSSVGTQFAQLAAAARGTALEGEGVRAIFEAVATASLVLGLSAEQTTGAMRALQQMISKGTVQAEELRGQLGERIPGAFQIAARAMQVTTRELGKMLEQGLVIAEELLPLMAKEMKKTFSPGVEEAVDQMTAAVNDLKTEWFLFLDGVEERTGVVEGLVEALKDLGAGFRVITKVVRGEGSIAGALEEIDEEIASVQERMKGFKGTLKELTGDRVEFARKLLQDPKGVSRTVATLEKEIELIEVELALLAVRRRAILESDVSGGKLGPPAPSLTFDELRVHPVAPFEKFRESMTDLGEVMKQLSGDAFTLEEKLDLVDALQRTTAATKKASKQLRKLAKDSEQLEAARLIKFGPDKGTLITMEELHTKLVRNNLRELERKALVEKATKALVNQQKEVERIAKNTAGFMASAKKKEIKDEAERITTIEKAFEKQLKTRLSATKKAIKDEAKVILAARKLVENDAKRQLKDRLALTKRATLAEGQAILDAQKVVGDAAKKQLRDRMKLTREELRKRGKELERILKIEEDIADVAIEAAGQVRLNEATLKGAEASKELAFQLEFEEQVRKLGIQGMTGYTDALMTAMRAGQAAADVEKELAEAMKDSFRAAKKIEALRDKVTKLQEKGKAEIESLKAANEVLELRIAGLDEEARLMEVRNEIEKKYGKVLLPETFSQLESAMELNKKLTEEYKRQQEVQKEARRLAKDFSRVIGSAFEDAVIKGEGFRGVLKGIVDDINRIIIRLAITKPFENFLTNALESDGEGGGIFGGFFAHGGRPPADKVSIVGEEGPELFKPDVSGTIIPFRKARLGRLSPGGMGPPDAPGTPTVSDVTTESVHATAIEAMLGLAGIGGFMSAVTSGLFGKFGVVGGSERPTVGTEDFARTVAAGQMASTLGAMAAGKFGRPGGVGSLGVGGGFAGGNLGGITGRAGGVGTPGVGGGFGGGMGSEPGEGGAGSTKGFAFGGRPPVGQPSKVGELGVEAFIPDNLLTANTNTPTVVVNQRFDFRGASLEAVALLKRETNRIRRETVAEIQRQNIRGMTASRR